MAGDRRGPVAARRAPHPPRTGGTRRGPADARLARSRARPCLAGPARRYRRHRCSAFARPRYRGPADAARRARRRGARYRDVRPRRPPVRPRHRRARRQAAAQDGAARGLQPRHRSARRARSAAAAAGRDAIVGVRHQRRRSRARQSVAAARPDRKRARCADPPHRGGAFPDVVSRTRPQPRPRQFGVRRGGRGARRGRGYRPRQRIGRRARRRQRPLRRPARARTRQALVTQPAGDDRRGTADAAPGRRAAPDRRGGGFRDRHPGSGRRAHRACPPHGIAARTGRSHDRRRGPVQRRPPARFLQPAVRDHGPDRPRMARREARVRPGARTDAGNEPASGSAGRN